MSSNRRKITKRAKKRVTHVPPRKKPVAKQTKKKVVAPPVEAPDDGPSFSVPVYVVTPPSQVDIDGRMISVHGRRLSELQLDEKLLQPANVIVPGLAAAGRVTMLAAREKMGKSTLMAYAAAQMSRGGHIWDQETVPCRVLWVGLEESPADAVTRFIAMGADPEMLTIVTRLAGEGGLTQLRAEIEAANPDLVIVDSLAAYARGIEDENNAVACTALLSPLVEFVHDSGIALVLLHHANKSGSGYRGSVAIGAAMDMILEMHPVERDQSLRRIEAKGRFRIDSYEVRYDVNTHAWTHTGEARTPQQRADDLQAAALEWIKANPNQGKEKIRAAMGRNATQTDMAIEALVSQNKVRHQGQRLGYVAA